MIRLEKILTEKQQKQHYHLEKLINTNVLQAKKYYLLSQIIEQAKFAYSPLGKAFETQTKTIEEQRKRQDKALEILKPEENKEKIKSVKGPLPKEMRFDEIKNEVDEIKRSEIKIKLKTFKI